MARLLLSSSASDDQAAILGDLHGKAGLATAAEFRERFRLLYLRLAHFPQSGSPRPAIGAGIRIGVVAPYVVIHRYIEADDTLTVLRIVHGRRKITGKLL